MGKNRKSRSHRARGPDPVGTAAIEAQINDAMNAENDGQVKEEKHDYTWEIIQQMADSSAVQRTIACHSLAHSLTPTSIHTLTSPLLTRLLHLTIDTDMDVCVAACQAVRTITSMGIEACEKLISCDGVTTLCGIMTHERLNRAGTTQRIPLLTHATASLFALCESFDRATSQVTSSIQTLLPIWISHLMNIDDSMISFHIEIAQLLLLLSEENDIMISYITSNQEMMSKLMSCMQDTRHTSLVNIAIAGVIIQCQPTNILMGTSIIPSSHPVATTLTSVLSVIQRIMSVDPINVTTTMIQTLLPQYKNMKEQLEAIELAAHKDLDKDGKDEMADATETKETKNDDTDDGMADDEHEKEIHPRKTSKPKDISPEVVLQEQWQSTIESSLITWRSHITSIRTALEILTNLCTTLETEDEEEEEKEAALTVAQHAIVGAGVLQHVLERGKCTMGSITSPITLFQQEMLTHLRTLFPTDDITSMTHLIDTLRARAHACCANLIQHLPRHVLGDINTVVTHACTLMETLSQAYSNKNTTAIAEFGPLTSLIWQCLLKDPSLTLSKPQFTALIQLARSGASEEIRTHAVGCITCLGMRDSYASQNFIIGTVLLEAMSSYLSSTPESSLDVCLLACDGLMDIYSEDHVHTNAINSLQLLPKLHAFGEAFTKHMRESKLQLDKPTRARCQGLMTNLKAFLEYKKDHI